jgi:hypothetical protein
MICPCCHRTLALEADLPPPRGIGRPGIFMRELRVAVRRRDVGRGITDGARGDMEMSVAPPRGSAVAVSAIEMYAAELP